MSENDDRYVAQALVDYAKRLTENHSIHAVLQGLGDFCTELLPVDGVGVLLLDEDRLTVATTNTPEGDAIEHLEVELGEGPCIESVRAGEPVLVDDLAAVSDRYPTFAPRALDAGVGAIHAIPLAGRGSTVGALDMMSRTPRQLSPTELTIAQMLCDVAVSYIYTVRLHEESTRLAAQLQSALDLRVVIEQAKGMLAERHGEDMPAAFERLRIRARSSNTTVRDVAKQVVQGRVRL